jgi:hypothetical protein
MIEEPGLRAYTLQEAYDKFGWRSYKKVRYAGEAELRMFDLQRNSLRCLTRDLIIIGMSISDGRIFVDMAPSTSSECRIYVQLADFVKDWKWPDGKPCGVMVPSKSIQKREAVQRGEDLE